MPTFISKRATELGLRREDATSAFNVQVLPKDIKAATKKNSRSCAFAVAVRREHPELTNAYFLRSTAWLEYRDRMVRYLLPSSVQREIVVFDRAGKCEPGIYSLTPPGKTQTMKASKAPKRKKVQAKRREAAKAAPVDPAKIRELRINKGLTQYDVAEKAAIPQTMVSTIERNVPTKRPTPERKKAEAAIMKVLGAAPPTVKKVKKRTYRRTENVRTLHEPPPSR